ncbi:MULTISPECIES: DUF427 domain-containing protein [unclassified Shimia]|uniref:DUF427 domain-containing protein n=1 Tax=unclassified Shimia TaxID=2630038 RepID=UPI001ADB0D82|nr:MULTISPECIES: DUF427 domain-containing protein [unclassified Shimia]MBO9473493.1 DUF427 domain-containing protein [Shimia sp. R10_1]MDA5555300.1 DUF427 domain-containing protein [Shimia sp. MMG029]
MTGNITIRKAEGNWVVRAGGAILGESSAALELSEDGYKPVIYFPRGDIATAFLDDSAKTTFCPHKGDARYYSIVTKSTTIKDAAWGYDAPVEGVERIKDHLAFHTSEQVAVERI